MIKRLFIIFILLFWSCDEVVIEQDNPLDPGNPEFDPPTVTFISGPDDGETITTSDVTFVWDGNDLITEYRTKYNNDSWAEWSNQTSVTFQYLDEGSYSFSIQGRYSTGDTSAVIANNFYVDAVQGPALMFYPRARFSNVGWNVTFQILAEEVTSLTAAQFNVTFDPDKLEIISVIQGSLLQLSGESIFNVEFDNETGSLSVITAALGGDLPSADGTGALLELVLAIKATGTSILEFDGTELFRDPDNNDITILEKVDGMVVAE